MADVNSSVRYASPGSPGIFANKIGWLDFTGLPGTGSFDNNTTYSVVNTISIPSGYTISFDITIEETFDDGYIPFAPLQPPVYPKAVFGNTAYVGVVGKVDIYMLDNATPPVKTVITLSNILVTDNLNIPISNYDIIAADGETTNSDETWSVTTNGNPWKILQILPPVDANKSKIDITGEGTKTIKYTGTTLDNSPTIILSTASPTTVSADLYTLNGKQGIVFGIMIPSTSVNGSLNITCCQ